jgi:hypothetical protein
MGPARLYSDLRLCSKRHEESLSSKAETAHSVVITGQPGIGESLSSVVSCALSNGPLREKVNHIGTFTLSVVVSANRSRSFGIKMATASCLSRMECFSETSRVSLPVNLRRTYGHSSMRMHARLVFPKHSVVLTQTST